MERNFMIEKRCSKCGEPKDLSLFNECAKSKDGLNSYCKACQKIANHARYNKNKNQITEDVKKWQNKNPQKVESYKKDFYEKNKLDGNGQ